jgi:predicted  nucleic acid-binding Zn-ribbon protein
MVTIAEATIKLDMDVDKALASGIKLISNINKSADAYDILATKSRKALTGLEKETIKIEKATTSYQIKADALIGTIKRSSLSLQQQNLMIRRVEEATRKNTDAQRNAALSDLEKARATRVLEKQLSRASEALKNATAAEKKLATETKKAEQAAKKSTKSLNQNATAAKKSGNAARNAAKQTGFMADKMTDLAKSVQIALGPLSGVAARITAITSLANRTLVSIAALISGFIAFGTVTFKAIKAGAEFEKQMFLIENRVRSSGMAAGFTAEQFNEMARVLGEETLTSVTQARDAIVTLLGITELAGENFQHALDAAQDLSASGMGDLTASTRRLARVLLEPGESLESLARAGVGFTLQQERMIKAFQRSGKTGQAMKIILDEITETVGGAGKAAALGLAGAFDSLQESFTRFLEEASIGGGVVNSLTTAIFEIAQTVKQWSESMGGAIIVGGTMNLIVTSLVGTFAFLLKNINVVAGAIIGLLVGKAFGALSIRVKRIGGVLKTLNFQFSLLRRRSTFAAAAVTSLKVAFRGLFGVIGLVVGILAALSFEAFSKAKEPIEDIEDSIEAMNSRLARFNRLQKEGFDSAELRRFEKDIKKRSESLSALNDQIKTLIDSIAKGESAFEKLGIEPVGPDEDPGKDPFEKSKRFLIGLQKEADAADKVLQNTINAAKILREQLEETAQKAKEGLDFADTAARAFLERIKGQTVALGVLQDKANEVFGKAGEGTFSSGLATAVDKARILQKKIDDMTFKKLAETWEDLRDQIRRELTAAYRKAGAAGETFGELMIDFFKKQQKAIDDVKLSLFVDSIVRAADATRRLTDATTEGGKALIEANIANAVAIELAKRKSDIDEKSKKSLEAAIRLREHERAQLENVQVLKNLDEELRLAQLNLSILDKSDDQKRMILALDELHLSQIKRGIDLLGPQAKLEELRTKAFIETTIAAEKLETFMEGISDAFATAFEDAILNAESFLDIISALEKELVKLILQATFIDPFKDFIKSGGKDTSGFGGPVADLITGTAKNISEGKFELALPEAEDVSESFKTLNSVTKGYEEQIAAATKATTDNLIGIIQKSGADVAASAVTTTLTAEQVGLAGASAGATTAVGILGTACIETAAAVKLLGTASGGGVDKPLNLIAGLIRGGSNFGAASRTTAAIAAGGFPKFAHGGVVGLNSSSDAVPIIAHRGEQVLTTEQQAEINDRLSGRRVNFDININVPEGVDAAAFGEMSEDIAANIFQRMVLDDARNN